MVERFSTYGKFWGCSDYPRCKGTLPCEQESPGWMKKLAKETLDRCLPVPSKREIDNERKWRLELREMYAKIYGE